MSIISNEHQPGSPDDQAEEPKRPSDAERVGQMLEAFKLIMAAMDPLTPEEQQRVINAARILLDRTDR